MRQLLTISILSVTIQATLSAKTIYVDKYASGSISGTSWSNAYRDLQTALYYANSGDQIQVAAGSYYPDEGTNQSNSNRFATFAMKNNVAIYGGYPNGGGTRDPLANPTILSGDLNQDDGNNYTNISDNAYHVVTGNSLTSSAVLDGFTITSGYASTGSFPHHRGAGLYLSSSPTIRNCTITKNIASYGAGAYVYNNATPTFTNCSFSGNYAGISGKGYGGAVQVANIYTAPTFTNCLFSGNYAEDQGGAISIKQTTQATTLINCTFSGNDTDGTGGAIEATTALITLRNTIIWNNRSNGSTNTTAASLYGSNSTLSCSKSLIQNYTASSLNAYGSSNINGTGSTNDPLFLSKAAPAVAPTLDGDYRLQQDSPMLDIGTNSYNSTTTDLAGNTRKQDTIDLGAYEGFVAPVISVDDSTPVTLVNHEDYNLGIGKTGTEGDFAFVVYNLSAAPLNDIAVTATGTHAGKITFTTTPGSSIAPNSYATLVGKVNFDFEGELEASISIASSSPDNNPFIISLKSTVASDETDSDGDGLDDYTELAVHGTLPNEVDSDGDSVGDGAEVALASLGFNPANGDTARADLIRTHATGLGMHSTASLDLGGMPYISKTGDTFTLNFKVKKSTDLSTWSDLTLTSHLKDNTSGDASMLFAMTSDSTTFYRIFMATPNNGVDSNLATFTDDDNDGVRNDTEQALQSLGFLNGQDDSELLTLIQSQASDLSLYSDNQIHYITISQTALSIHSDSSPELSYNIKVHETTNGATAELQNATPSFNTSTHEATLEFQNPSASAQIYRIILK
ncbi:polymorphic outer membrane protein repeat-containing protein/parallel beta-helix repeat (two copies) [Rubritalea squalenifaciens DSM 18772]|uniref:Polymorphic outer membrane protein repeat-containing protein/parallel beta-helix repeat (Two copies) n=1 Tax=Rubritalea squalenifaciens DSM 18772 TaxID=1123071 RepID=A0A1M6SHW0_9BACT|nr:right-handed parallel beta-helix repeat-containing protein [Rubritalea squalenifaciens]SHK44128.1 polymorphic outer membrane protein repeat-containing protein/parallel beta-helix repeat (two copies) [Rubritalea squalenifaciens DSM 18772]